MNDATPIETFFPTQGLFCAVRTSWGRFRSVENQRLMIKKWGHQHQIPIMRHYIDNGFSGKRFERLAVQRLLDLVQKGAVNCIIVKDFSCFRRNYIEVEYYLERVFPLYNVHFISINDGYDSAQLRSNTGGLSVAFKYLIAELYSRDLSIKYKSAKYMKFKRGEYQSKICPYGFRKSSDGRMVPDGEAADIIRLIFGLNQNGLGRSRLSGSCTSAGSLPRPSTRQPTGLLAMIISRCNGIWQESTVARILEDERYTGTFIMGKHEVTKVGGHKVKLKDGSQCVKIPDHHPAIISKELYDRAQVLRPHASSEKKISIHARQGVL